MRQQIDRLAAAGKPGQVEETAAWTFAAVRTLFCGWRAATQAISSDEALNYLRNLDGSWARLWRWEFDANHHVLYSFAAKLMTELFAPSEFALRIPSVLAGFAMMLGIFRLLEVCERPWVRWMAFVGLGLHPLLLDFSVAARGYGMGLAFLVWAIYALNRERPKRAGLLFGLGIAANLTIVLPALASVGAIVLLRGSRAVRTAGQVLGIAAIVAAAICVYPMRGADLGHFYVGFEDWRRSVADFVYTATRVVPRGPGLFGTETAARWISLTLLPAELLVCGWFAWRSPFRAQRRSAVTLALTLAGLVTAHWWFGMRYPVDRTGLYFVILAGFPWAVATDTARAGWMRWTQAGLAAVLIVQFATQLQWTTFRTWPFNGSARTTAVRMKSECMDRPPGSVRLFTWLGDQATFEYYRLRYDIDCVAPTEFSVATYEPGFDYYLTRDAIPGAAVLYQGEPWETSLVRAPQSK